jgi:hypothetical protein
MATSFDVNLTIGSTVGVTQVQGIFNGIMPRVETIKHLDSDTLIGASGYNANSKILKVNELEPFVFKAFGTSTAQAINLTNYGNVDLTVTDILFTFKRGITPVFYFSSSTISLNSSTITVAPDSTATFHVAYTGPEVGEYTNFITIVSNNNTGPYKIITRQSVSNSTEFSLNITSYSTTIVDVGDRSQVTYVITPILNQELRPDIDLSLTFSLSGSVGWKILTTSTNSVTLEFESNDIDNINGTYVGTLLIDAGIAGSASVTNTATVNINYADNYNITSWLSPIAHNNSVVGISYDVINGEKTLTIGAGLGGDGGPVYDAGGSIFLNVKALGIGSNNVDFPYPYWAEVYRFTGLGTGTAKTYLSGYIDPDGEYVYQKKFTDGLNYGYYFGYERSFGSMFVVNDDGAGNLRISLANLREISGDDAFDATLYNFTRSFHYYSNVDEGGRIVNLPQYPFNTSTVYTLSTSTTPLPTGETRTNLFLGFDALSSATYTVVTSLVELPI